MIEGDKLLKVETTLGNDYKTYFYIWQGFVIFQVDELYSMWMKAESIKEWKQIYENKQQGTMRLYEGIYNGYSRAT